jgi:hypothetical protein
MSNSHRSMMISRVKSFDRCIYCTNIFHEWFKHTQPIGHLTGAAQKLRAQVLYQL